MYLKSIEVHGFKSFAHKLVFEFKDGITAIVGPNGSGKSNVADAVRWVLGEQSAKQLRGSKMEDVIFSGTETRRPQGFAYVAITLDNSDHKLATSYEEVTVARRVYRSGESEYLINGSNCRLKDVQELFLDTGIGKEGYSIIGQGQIDQILSGKPEDRRELFDEAAGIVKFKKRKGQAEKSLEAERQNLCRINDILKEIETQITPLERQSVVAKEYLTLRDELKNLDINMFLMEYDRINGSLGEMEEKEVIAQTDLSECKTAYEATKEEYTQLEGEMEEKQVLLDEKKNLLGESRVKKEKLEGEVKVLNEQIIATRQNSEHYKERVAELENDIQLKTEQLNEYNEKKRTLDESLHEIMEEQKKEEEAFQVLQKNILKGTQDIEEINLKIKNSLNDNINMKTNLERYETMLEQGNIKKAELTQKILKNKSDESEFEENIKQEEANLSTVSEKIRVITSNIEEFEKDLKELENEVVTLANEKNTAQQTYHREESRMDSLKNMTERYDGYGQSIRKVMEQKSKNPGILGVVADLVKVNKAYETAIEIALGGSIQNIVTEDERTAKSLIGYLKENKLGRATFLPLTTISNRGGFKDTGALKEPGVIGLASGLVEADSRFSGLVDYLLGRILVVDHIDNAIALARKYNQSLRIVTLEGDLMNPGGSMSGGAYKNSGNLLSRRREMEDLEALVAKRLKELQELDKKASSAREKGEKIKQVINQNKEQLQSLYLVQNTAKLKYNQTLAFKEENQKILNQIVTENEGLETQVKELKENIQKLKGALYETESGVKNKEEDILNIGQQLEDMRKQEMNQREKVEALKMTYSTKEQSGQFILENISRIEEELKRLSFSMEELHAGVENGTSLMTEKEAAIQAVKAAIEEFETLILSLEEEIKAITREKEEIDRSHKDFFTKREELSGKMNELDKEVFRLGNLKEKMSEQLEGLMNYMWEEYELTYNQALSHRIEVELAYSVIKKNVSELKNKIRSLGDVNINAIEDYKNMLERYTLLKTQHDDLIKSEEVLQKIIEELDEEMRKQFAVKFEEIKIQFDKVFKELFGGGKGTIELVEDEDILEAGVRIIAQPPGKKLQNMMQLSGGEKALTAISLLFAIQNLKPSPFCLLDEIEAALDDSNVSRFAKYLHKLTRDTQFIVITHRRGTMAAADILYGITMQEKGVSTLVSVNLLEGEIE